MECALRRCGTKVSLERIADLPDGTKYLHPQVRALCGNDHDNVIREQCLDEALHSTLLTSLEDLRRTEAQVADSIKEAICCSGWLLTPPSRLCS